MKKLMLILLCLCMCFSFLSACSKTTEPQFKVGDIVVSSMGESYTQLIALDNNMPNGDIVEIASHKIKAIKKLDATNLEDYASSRYYQYLYLATVVGKVDSKYAGKVIFFDSQYPTKVETKAIDGYGTSVGALINDDGSFELNYYVYCNEVLSTFYPNGIRVWTW